MVDDANRILGRQEFTQADRLDPERSYAIWLTYSQHYTPGMDPELVARRWNGGPKGDRKNATLGYWKKVKSHL